MSTIFPGMDPYLEEPAFWPGVHHAFVVYLAGHLQPRLGPSYVAGIEERVYIEEEARDIVPDIRLTETRSRRRDRPRSEVGVALLEPETEVEVEADAPEIVRVNALEIHESYVTILDRRANLRIVTIIELISPTNKCGGAGRRAYLDKQRSVLASDTHLVEIDLLRQGEPVVALPDFELDPRRPFDYLVCVNRARGTRGEYEIYLRNLRQRLPRIRVPLAEKDPDVIADLQAVFEQTYESGRYRARIDYAKPCVPPLSETDQAWADECIRTAIEPATSG